MMKAKLENLLVEITDIESRMEGLAFVLDILGEYFEVRNQMELFYIVQFLDEWIKNEFAKLMQVSTELDQIIIHIE